MTNFCIDCGKKISIFGIRCNPCAQKHRFKNPKNTANYINGKTLKTYYCIDCGKKISVEGGIYGSGRCRSCSTKYLHKTGKLNSKGKNNPMFGIRKFGKNNPNYVNGTGNAPYPLKFSKILKESIRKRDNYICQKCNITEEEHLIVYGKILCVHHIDYDKENCKEKNLITLCDECNKRVNHNRKYWQVYFSKKNKKVLIKSKKKGE